MLEARPLVLVMVGGVGVVALDEGAKGHVLGDPVPVPRVWEPWDRGASAMGGASKKILGRCLARRVEGVRSGSRCGDGCMA